METKDITPLTRPLLKTRRSCAEGRHFTQHFYKLQRSAHACKAFRAEALFVPSSGYRGSRARSYAGRYRPPERPFPGVEAKPANSREGPWGWRRSPKQWAILSAAPQSRAEPSEAGWAAAPEEDRQPCYSASRRAHGGEQRFRTPSVDSARTGVVGLLLKRRHMSKRGEEVRERERRGSEW